MDASSSRLSALPPSSPVPSSEAGEIEEARAGLLGERYWVASEASRRELQRTGGTSALNVMLSSEDEVRYLLSRLSRSLMEACTFPQLAMSPVRPHPRTLASSAENRRPAPSPSLAAPTFRRLSSGRQRPPSSLLSPKPSLPHPDDALRGPQRSPSPANSDASSHVLDIIARPRPHAQHRPSRSPSPSQAHSPSPVPRKRHRTATPSPSSSSRASSPVDPPESAHLIAGRALRTRTVAQLKPYSVEQLKYTKTLLKNGWEGAVVRTKRPVEETAEELQRKKEELARRPKDSLGGWLVSDEENETGESLPRLQGGSLGSADPSSGLQSDEDGMTLLEREARRKERMERAVAAAMGGNAKKRRESASCPTDRAFYSSFHSFSLLASPTRPFSHRPSSLSHRCPSFPQETTRVCRVGRRAQRLVQCDYRISSTQASTLATRRKCSAFVLSRPHSSQEAQRETTTTCPSASFWLFHHCFSSARILDTTTDTGRQ